MDLTNKQVWREEQLISLTPTGWALLEILLRKSPEVVSRTELEESLWQGEPPNSDSLKVHLYNLRSVIDRPFEKEIIHTVSGQGVVLRRL